MLPACAAAAPLAQEMFEFQDEWTDMPDLCRNRRRIFAKYYGERLRPAVGIVLASCRPTLSASDTPEEFLRRRAFHILEESLPASWALNDLESVALDMSLPLEDRRLIFYDITRRTAPAAYGPVLARLLDHATEPMIQQAVLYAIQENGPLPAVIPALQRARRRGLESPLLRSALQSARRAGVVRKEPLRVRCEEEATRYPIFTPGPESREE